jgi:riboflavin synthase
MFPGGAKMFSGLIDAIGEVHSVLTTNTGKTLVVRAPGCWESLQPGASVAIDGVCLTLTQSDASDGHFDVVAETLRTSTLGQCRSGSRVNLQKALSLGDRIDGHFVQGHVDAVARIDRVEDAAGESVWWFAPGPEAMAYIIPKGSVAIDGISLTVANIREERFSVALIPTTLRETTLSEKRVGSAVNVETDILARTVVGYLRSLGSRGTGSGESGELMELLKKQGFA